MRVSEVRRLGAAFVLVLGIGSTQAVVPGEPMPHTALPDRNGKLHDLAALHGKPIYVDFWASWCAPCRKSFPFMNALQHRYAARGVVVIAINVDTERKDADEFLAHYPAEFGLLFDGDGATAAQYGVKGMPSSYLIGPDGVVRHVHMGFRNETPAAVEAELDAMLK